MKFSFSEVFALFCLFLLTSCAFETLDKGLPRLAGKHIDVAINYLGMPDAEQTIANRKIYIWGRQNSGSYVRPVTQTSTYTGYGYTAYGTSTSYVNESYDYTCTIKLIVNKKDIIQSHEYEGNLGGCEYFSSSISELIKDTELQVKESP